MAILIATLIGVLMALVAGLALLALKGSVFCVGIEIEPPVEMEKIVQVIRAPMPMPMPMPQPIVQYDPAPQPEPLRYRAEEL
jgi:hypothetical protein